jgi:Ca-activated chloride channel family protein
MISMIIALVMLIIFTSCAMKAPTGNQAPMEDGGMANFAPSMGESFDSEGYTEITENGFVKAEDNNTSYFSIDANTASYPNLRSIIKNRGYMYKDAVRVEEMLNYFNYDYKTPEGDDILALTSSLFDTPYNSETKLLTIGLAADEVEFSEIKNNLVFLIDTSGSMYSDDKLPLVQQAFMVSTKARAMGRIK